PAIRYAATAIASAEAIQSHHITRWRKRGDTGNTRKHRNSTNATCTGRSVCVGTIAYAVYRWNADITNATPTTNACSQPLNLLAAPSSASMNSSALCNASSLTATASGSPGGAALN